MPASTTANTIIKNFKQPLTQSLLKSLKPYVKTPLVYSPRLSQQAKCHIRLKQEFTQPSGSYKLRGLSHLVAKRLQSLSPAQLAQKPVRVVAASGGNAGNAVALAASFYNVDATVVVPTCTTESMKSKISGNGAQLITAGNTIGEADEYLQAVLIPSLEEDYTVVYCHPYNIPEIWEGHSSMVDEIVAQLRSEGSLNRLKGVVCSVGGGGLYNGLVQGLKKHGLTHVPIVTLETDSVPTFQAAIDRGEPVTLSSFNSIATSLACPYITQQSLDNYHNHETFNHLVSDVQAANACLRFCVDYNIIVEPACGVALCSVYEDIIHKSLHLSEDDIVVVVVCGGSATSMQDLVKYQQMYSS